MAGCKLLLVANNGGHLLQLVSLREVWERYDRVWVTGDKSDRHSLLKGERVLHGHHPTDRNIPNMLRNFVMALRLLFRERPAAVMTTGAAMAVPFCYAAKLFGIKVIYLESFAKLTSPTFSGRLVYPISDLFLIQWPAMKEHYPRAVYAGTVYDHILDSRTA